MRINGRLSGDLTIKSIRLNKETGARVATALLTVKVEGRDARSKLGDRFTRLVFGQMEEQENGDVLWPCEQITRPCLVCEAHQVIIFGHTITAMMPTVPKIKTVRGERTVIMDLLLYFKCDALNRELIADLATSCGDFVEAEFKPVQMEIGE